MASEIHAGFGTVIRWARLASDLSTSEAAKRASMSAPRWNYIETGRAEATRDEIRAMCCTIIDPKETGQIIGELQAEVAERTKERDALSAQVAQLIARANDGIATSEAVIALQRQLAEADIVNCTLRRACAHCNHVVLAEDMPEHWRVCDKHPARWEIHALKKAIAPAAAGNAPFDGLQSIDYFVGVAERMRSEQRTVRPMDLNQPEKDPTL